MEEAGEPGRGAQRRGRGTGEGFDLVWARPERPARGRGLSRQQIVRAAIDLADRDGLDALTMRGVAQQLGAGTMSLYWYVRNKDELIELMRDEVAGELSLQEPSGDWRADLATVARDTRRIFLRHPWLASVAWGTPPLGPNSLRQDELTTAALSGLGVDQRTQGAVGAAVHFFVIGFVLRELAQEQLQQRTGVTIEQWRASVGPYIQAQLASGRYPNLARVISSGEEMDNEAVFEFVLNFILDAVAAQLPAD
ncbi:MAG TPA: TetR/AcrR family transcriptional regulator [Actinomycetes bacterium]